jgi:hypothetical protein
MESGDPPVMMRLAACAPREPSRKMRRMQARFPVAHGE